MPQIKYEFVATGQAEVVNAIKSVERASAQASARARQTATGGGAPGAPGGPKAKGYKGDPQMDAYWKASVKAAEQQGRAMQKEHEREYREKERHKARMAAADAREKRRQEVADAKAAKQKAAEEEKARKHVAGIKERHFRDEQRREEREERRRQVEAERAKQKRQTEAERARQAALAKQASGAETSRNAMWELAGPMLAYKAASKVIDSVTSAAREAVALQENTRRLSINARQAGQDFVDPSALRKDFQKAALANPGQSAMAISEAMQSFVSLTGNLETGRQSAGTFATVASATGAQVGDVSQAAASIFNQFGLQTKEEMQDVLASLTFQGKTGAFELRDAASQFQRLAAAGASFGLTGAKGVKTIGGLAQIARTGTGSAEQTTTAIENIFTNLVAKSDLLKQQGVNVYDKKGKTRDVAEVLIESIVKAGGSNFEKKGQILQKVFGDQGIRGVRPLMAKYQAEFQGVRNKGGSEAEASAAGLKRLREEIDKSINAPGAWEEVQKDAAEAQKDASAQMALQWERVKAIVADNVIPTFEKVSPKVMEALFGTGDDLGPALKAVEAFAEATALAGDVIGEFVDSLYATGILERKPKTPAQEKAEAEKRKVKAEKALAKFDDETKGLYQPGTKQFGPIDPAMAKERERLTQAVTDADAGVKSAEEKMWTKPGQKTKDMTANDFALKYMELGAKGGDQAGWLEGEAGYDARARRIAQSLEFNPKDATALGNVGDEANDEQLALVREYQLQQTLAKNRPKDEAEAAGVEQLSAAAENAATALNKIAAAGQPTIMGAPP